MSKKNTIKKADSKKGTRKPGKTQPPKQTPAPVEEVTETKEPAPTPIEAELSETENTNEPRTVKINDVVNYVFTEEEEKNFGNKTVSGTVSQTNEDQSVILKAEPRPGMNWHTGAKFSETKEPGTWHWPE